MAAPLAELPGTYYFVVSTYDPSWCGSYVAVLDWRGPALPRTSSLEIDDSCPNGFAAEAVRPAVEVPAPATVTGDTITWTFPARPELARGRRLWAMAAGAPNPEANPAIYPGTSAEDAHTAYDFAVAERAYVIGGTR